MELKERLLELSPEDEKKIWLDSLLLDFSSAYTHSQDTLKKVVNFVNNLSDATYYEVFVKYQSTISTKSLSDDLRKVKIALENKLYEFAPNDSERKFWENSLIKDSATANIKEALNWVNENI
jgi:hypothetical protein